MSIAIVSRSTWGGPIHAPGAAYGQPMVAVTVHHTLSPALPITASEAQERAAVLGIHRDHVNRQRWAGIGYNFVIFQSGRVYEGRGWGRIGAHAGSAAGNRTLGVVFAINGETTTPSPAALRSLATLRDAGVRLGHLTRGHATKLHSDWKATICPGRRVVEALAGFAPTTPRIDGHVFQPGHHGPLTEQLQRLLVAAGYMTEAEFATGPGKHGPRTERALRTMISAHT
jgi:peptidoglycan recognition protein